MKKYVLLIFTLFLFCSFLQNNPNIIVPPEKSENNSVTLLFSGDIMGHSPQFKAAYNSNTNSFNYDICFNQVRSIIQSADFAIANLEVPIAGKPYSGYPRFSSPDALLDALRNAGYNILLTANNHALDRGKTGLERTIRQIEKRNFYHLGTYNNKIQRDSTYPLIIEKHGFKIAILNCTYGTNDNVVTKPNYINLIDTAEIKNDIHKTDSLGVSFKIMTIHWGSEYELAANDYQRKLAHFFVNQGINLIIGSHPHVVQNAEYLYNRDSIQVPVFYSLGNSISNQRDVNTDGGIMIKVEIDIKSAKIIKTCFIPIYVYRGTLNGEYQYHLIPTSDFYFFPTRFPISKSDSTSLNLFESNTKYRLSNISSCNM